MSDLFRKLIQRTGDYSLPFLINLYNKEKSIDLFFINDVKKKIYNGKEYIPATFKYTPNNSIHGLDGGGKLSIEIDDRNREVFITNLIDTNSTIYLDVIGAMNSRGDISEIRIFNHHFCSVNVTKDKAEFTFEKDDRLQMTFPALVWNRLNNRGNS